MTREILTIGMFVAAGAWAQVGAPLLGYLPQDGQIRQIFGIPSAAAVGQPIEGQRFAQAAASPEHEFVVTSSAETGRVMLYSATGLRPIEGAGIAPDAVGVSPRGSAAVLWFASISRAQVASGLPDAPALRNIDTPFRPSIPALAVSDDGAWIAGAWADGLYAFGPRGEPVSLPVTGRIGALAFEAGGHTLAVANGEGVHVITGLDTQVSVSTLFDSEDALHTAGVAIAGGRVLAADHSGAVVSVDLRSRATSTVDCYCRPDGLFGLGSGVFRLTGLEDGSVRLFNSATGQVLFAPLALHEGGRP